MQRFVVEEGEGGELQGGEPGVGGEEEEESECAWWVVLAGGLELG